jgi:hypothetical protein
MTAVGVCIYRYREDFREPGQFGSMPICPWCEVAGCCCEWCEGCEHNVNPYDHFTWPCSEDEPGTCPAGGES